ncbi:MAG: nucleotide kinase domain-containing protein [Nanoarchaeota archaeon]
MNLLEKEFFSFIYQRQLIYHKRFVQKLPPPWTSDPVLQKFKIINMYRELDACTLYLMQKLKDIDNRKTLLLNIAFFRFFNQRNLYEDLEIEPFDDMSEDIKQQLIITFERRKREGKNIFNDAYLISSGEAGKKKHESVLNALHNTDFTEIILKIDCSKMPRESLEVLENIPMVGPFLACEIWTDLSYLKFFKQEWTDNDFVNIGPGAKWGLEILADKKLTLQEQEDFLHNLHKLQESVLPEIHLSLNESLSWQEIAYKEASSNIPFLSLTNIEGALCEFRKYNRLSQGLGKRRYFHPQDKI